MLSLESIEYPLFRCKHILKDVFLLLGKCNLCHQRGVGFHPYRWVYHRFKSLWRKPTLGFQKRRWIRRKLKVRVTVPHNIVTNSNRLGAICARLLGNCGPTVLVCVHPFGGVLFLFFRQPPSTCACRWSLLYKMMM